MSFRESLASLILGLVLIAVGVLFLARNLGLLEFDRLFALKLIFPTLFLAFGLYRLIRHFTVSARDLTERPGRSGLLTGIFLTSLGVISGLHILEVLSFADFVGIYWPLLLVLFGLGKIVDFYRLRGRLQFRLIEIFGVIFVIVFGLTCGLIARTHFTLMDLPFRIHDDLSLGDLFGRKNRWRTEEIFAASGVEELVIANIYGDVTVSNSYGDVRLQTTHASIRIRKR